MLEGENGFWTARNAGRFVRRRVWETFPAVAEESRAMDILLRVKHPVTELFARVLDRIDQGRPLGRLVDLEPRLSSDVSQRVSGLMDDERYEDYKVQLECLRDLMMAGGSKEVSKINARAVKDAWRAYKDGKDVLLITASGYAQNPEERMDLSQVMCPELDIRVLRPIGDSRLEVEIEKIRRGTPGIYGRTRAVTEGGVMVVDFLGGGGWQVASRTQAEQLYDGILMVAANNFRSIPGIRGLFEKADIQITNQEIKFWLGLVMVGHEDAHSFQRTNFGPVELLELYADMGGVVKRFLECELDEDSMKKLTIVMYGELQHALQIKPENKGNQDAYYWSAVRCLRHLKKIVVEDIDGVKVDLSEKNVRRVLNEVNKDFLVLISNDRQAKLRLLKEVKKLTE